MSKRNREIMSKRGREYQFVVMDSGHKTPEQIKEDKIIEIERKKKDLDCEFDPDYVDTTQACLPYEDKTLSINKYIISGSEYYFIV